MLFHDGYAIVEANDTLTIQFYYYRDYQGDYFVFNTHDNSTLPYNSGYFRVDASMVKQVPGFAFDVRPAGYLDYSEKFICHELIATEQLKNISAGCSEDITLRELTQKERAKIEQYKAKQKGKFRSELLKTDDR